MQDTSTAKTVNDLSPATASGGGDNSASSNEPRVPFRLFALKSADTFMVADANGNVLGEGDGLFHEDTRLLSRWRMTVGGRPPSLLSASVSHDNVMFTSNLTNRPLPPLGGRSMPEGVIHIERTRLLWHDRMYERIALTNFAAVEATIPIELEFAADFRDMFEVRGMRRAARGHDLPPERHSHGMTLAYRGLDGVLRRCAMGFSDMPAHISSGRVDFLFSLPRGGTHDLYIEIGATHETPSRERHRAAAARAHFGARSARRCGATLRSSGRVFDDWIDKSRADLALLTTALPTGPYPYAGIPWFSTPFGRDAIITALQMLWLDSSLARGVLRFLAARQAHDTSTFRDSAPGKIMHETRKGEMAALHELPFGEYYGGVDTTPLFVMLAAAYARRTGDLALIDELWPALVAAMAWIEGPGDSDGDGFVDYQRGAETGLANQGWKDSHDSVFHADGSDPVGAIALIEVQGYVFAALNGMAGLAERRREPDAAEHWRRKAEDLRRRVEERFWMPTQKFYAMAIDGSGRPCAVRGSNVGHLLYTGLPAQDRARPVIEQLLAGPFHSGYGIRTLARGESRFNPMSYHNGSVWPHDTALAVAGMARYGERAGVIRLMSDMFEAAVRFDMRLPELYCGFQRGAGEAPVAYPVACLPQAWASGSVFMLLQSCLGLSIDGVRGEVHIDKPRLPHGIDQLTIRSLSVGDRSIDVTFQRAGSGVVAFSDAFFNGTIPVVLRA